MTKTRPVTSVPCYLPAVRSLRRSRIPAAVLALVLGVALVVPEVSHTLEHRYEAAQAHGRGLADHDDGQHHDPAPGPAEAGLADGHSHGDHPHFDLVATQPVRPLLAYAVVVQAVVLLLQDCTVERPLPPACTTGLSPGRLDHGPPSPSRAPPLV